MDDRPPWLLLDCDEEDADAEAPMFGEVFTRRPVVGDTVVLRLCARGRDRELIKLPVQVLSDDGQHFTGRIPSALVSQILVWSDAYPELTDLCDPHSVVSFTSRHARPPA